MLRCLTEVAIQQRGEGRNLSLKLDFVNTFEVEESWEDLTNSGRIVFPKNIYAIDGSGKKYAMGGTEQNKQLSNLFRKGDSISIKYGYYRYDEYGKEYKELNEVFAGFISKVHSKMPVELELEDNMWILKQTPAKPQVWPKDKTVEDLFRSLLSGAGFTVNALTKTTIGDFLIQEETVAQVLERLRKDYHLEAYFKGNELRIGSKIYVDSEAKRHKFVFQKNIISDELEYSRRDDVKLSAVCKAVTVDDGGNNKRGYSKQREKMLQVLVYNQGSEFKYVEKADGVDLPANDEGERRTLFFFGITQAKELAERGIDELKKYYYDGFKGSFTTFATPFVEMGDVVELSDTKLPDRKGAYKVKRVKYEGGVNGHRQTITLHYKV